MTDLDRDHLLEREGRRVCAVCSRLITVGPDGTEYGHQRWSDGHDTQGRCPHRPRSVDPTNSGAVNGLARDASGRFIATDGGEA